jgi:hypothetical protein
MVGFDPDISLVPLARYANSKIRAQRSSSGFLTWARGGRESTQIRDGEGLPANKARPSGWPPRLLATWEQKVSWRREIRARYCPGYKWAVHGALNPRYGESIPNTTADATAGLQDDAGDQNLQAIIHREQSRPALSNSTDGSVVPVTTISSAPVTSRQPAPLPDSNIPLFRDVPAIHDQHGKVSSSERDSLYADPSASMAPSNQIDDSMSYESQHIQSSCGPRTSTLVGSQDESDVPTDTGVTANDDILASLNRGMDRIFEKIRSLALQHIQDGALDHALHEDVMREAVQQVFGTITRADSVHGRPSLGPLPLTEPINVGEY